MPWAFKLCLAKVTGPSQAYVYTVNRSCLERLPGWVFWQLLTALLPCHLIYPTTAYKQCTQCREQCTQCREQCTQCREQCTQCREQFTQRREQCNQCS